MILQPVRKHNLVQAWSSWEAIAEFHQELAETRLNWAPMAEFVRQVADSRYTVGLYPGNSMATLLIAQTPLFEWKREVLEVEFLTQAQRFRFDFWEEPGTKQYLSRECEPAEAFALLEKLLRMKRWFLDGTDQRDK